MPVCHGSTVAVPAVRVSDRLGAQYITTSSYCGRVSYATKKTKPSVPGSECMALQEQVLVKDVMSTPLVTISADTLLVEAAQEMRRKNISALLVTTAPPSIVTTTDVLEAVAQGMDTSRLDVADVMTESVETVPPSLQLREAAAMMETFGISHLPVATDDYIGMVSSTDITAHLS